MKSKFAISLGRQIQLAVCVFVLLPATLSYGPASAWFEKLELGLRQLTSPLAEIDPRYQPLLISLDAAGNKNALLLAILGRLDRARSVTIIDPVIGASDALNEAIRYNGAVYLTDQTDANGSDSDAATRAAARQIGHARLPGNSRERYLGLSAWQLSGSRMRASAALQPLLFDEQWSRRHRAIYSNSQSRLFLKRVLPIEPLTARAWLALPAQDAERDAAGHHVFIGAQPATQSDSGRWAPSRLVSFGMAHAALASGEVLLQPHWAQSISWLVIAVGMFALVSLLWRESRRVILISGLSSVALLLFGQWLLTAQFAIQIDLLRPLIALACGFTMCFWLTPDRTSQRRESFRSGVRYLRSGRLDAAFRVLKQCPPHPSLMPTLYKLAIAFDKRSQPEQAKAVFAYMSSHEQQPMTTATPLPEARTQNIISDDIPQQLGRYEVLRPLGKGAMGGVFLARDPRINRLIALKIVSFSNFDDEALKVEMRARFFQEAESVGRLTHPSITAIYDSGEENELGFIAMEYAPGVQLNQHTAKESLLDPVTVFTIGMRVAEALHYAHSEHVVHRDIKPDNLIFDAQSEAVKITDFGIAKLVDAERTQTGIILGTPSYMAPEQVMGDAVTGSSDLFSLGVTLYELLTGEIPFHGKTIAELMTAITEKTPASVSSFRPELSPAVDTFMTRALAKQPENRFSDGNEMAFALRECLSSLFTRAVNQ